MAQKSAYIVVDLGFGDAGKGSIVDALVRRTDAHTVVRFNGGAQAAHNVVTPGGRHHTFSQFGSGSFVPGVRTVHTKHVLVNPIFALEEARALHALGVTDALERLHIDTRALITTPFHWITNRIREIARGDGLHGSCGKGIGETMSDYLQHGELMPRIADLLDPLLMREKLERHREIKRAEIKELLMAAKPSALLERELTLLNSPGLIDETIVAYQQFRQQVTLIEEEELAALLNEEGTIIFEGAQGILLDEWHGFHPYTTWSTTISANALETIREVAYDGDVTTLGLVRAYATRHGAGPFVTEDEALTREIPDEHNDNNAWQHEFRVGHYDAVATSYALEATGGVDGLVVSHLDRVRNHSVHKICVGYRGDVNDDAIFTRARDGDATGMVVKHDEDLDRQEKLTNALLAAEPVYIEVEHSDLLTKLAQLHGVPILGASLGKTADDKAFDLSRLAQAA